MHVLLDGQMALDQQFRRRASAAAPRTTTRSSFSDDGAFDKWHLLHFWWSKDGAISPVGYCGDGTAGLDPALSMRLLMELDGIFYNFGERRGVHHGQLFVHVQISLPWKVTRQCTSYCLAILAHTAESILRLLQWQNLALLHDCTSLGDK